MTTIVLHFSREETANFLVAGIPAAARAVHQLALAVEHGQDVGRCVIAVPGGWSPSGWCRDEMARLAPNLDIRFADSRALRGTSDTMRLQGEALHPARRIAALMAAAKGDHGPASSGLELGSVDTDDQLRALRRQGQALLAATGKPGDGIVSRHLNRPVSRAISASLLRFPGISPMHGTIAAAVLGLAMALCLFLGGEPGLMLGAALFQLASIVDGVDGEIARVTFRSSRAGAMLDSLTDALTNLSFFAGLTFNVWSRGGDGAAAGTIGLMLLALGLLVIGRQALVSGRPFTFDAVKERFTANPSRLKQWLTWLTMRDFYAAAAAVCVLVGLVSPMLVAFAMAATVWLTVTLVVLARADRGIDLALSPGSRPTKVNLADLVATH